MNGRLNSSDVATCIPLNWLTVAHNNDAKDEPKYKWEELKFPSIPSNSFLFSAIARRELFWKRSKVSVSQNIQELYQESHQGLTWYSSANPPDRIMLLESSIGKFIKVPRKHRRFLRGFEVAPIWTTYPKFIPNTHIVGMTSEFPLKWNALCGVKFAHYFGFQNAMHIWNPEHPVVSHLDAEGWDFCVKAFVTSLDLLALKNEVLLNRSRASAWMIMCLSRESSELWDGLKDRDPTFLPDLWEIVFPDSRGIGAKEKVLCHWVEGLSDSRLRILTPNGWAALSYYKEHDRTLFNKYLPNPGVEWRVTVKIKSCLRHHCRSHTETARSRVQI